MPKRILRQDGYLQRLYREAQPIKHKIPVSLLKPCYWTLPRIMDVNKTHISLRDKNKLKDNLYHSTLGVEIKLPVTQSSFE
jgi:hypothetical protein